MVTPVIVDYGMGNLHSVEAALRYLGYEPLVSDNPDAIKCADMLLLPGVGSFHKAMGYLEATGLADALREAVLVRGKKILGICLGQQLMAEYGHEDGGRAGLKFFAGEVERLPSKHGIKIPHVGFHSVLFDPASQLCRGLNNKLDCYFVHSYRVALDHRPGLTAVCEHGEPFVAAYEHENVFAVQFHPEKSQTNGLRLLSNFLSA